MRTFLRITSVLTLMIAGVAMRPKNAMADYALPKGCWYTPPEPMACNICASTCNGLINQQCCIIVAL